MRFILKTLLIRQREDGDTVLYKNMLVELQNLIGQTVRIYKNLRRDKNCMSVMVKTSQGWRVAAHGTEMIIAACTFPVSETTRQWVLKNKKKKPHAFIEGVLIATEANGFDKKLSYNPFKGNKFTVNGQPVDVCKLVAIKDNICTTI